MVGAGIFGLPADAARLAGAWSPVLFLLCGVLMTTLMASFAQASSYFQGTGGPILYTRAAFGPFAAFETGWVLYVGRVTSFAANANLLATYLAGYVEGLGTGVGRVAVIFVLAAFFAAVNVVGVKRGMGSVMAITVAKFVPLAVFVLVGLAYLRPGPFAGAAPPPLGEFGGAMLLVFYAFIGFEGALIPAGESRDPKRDMPRALFATAAFVTVLYVLVQAVSVAVEPDLAASKRPLADAAARMMGPFGAAMISIGALMSILGNSASAVLSAPRMTYALALEGSLPRVFGRVHERFATPHVSIVVYCALGFALGASGTFADLAVMSSFARLLGYAASVASIPRLRRRFAGVEGEFRLPGGLAIPAAALLICAWLMAQVDLPTVGKTAALVAVGAGLYGSAKIGQKKGPAAA